METTLIEMPKFITSLGILRGSHSLKKYSSNDREYFSDVYHLNSEILEKAQLYLDRIKDKSQKFFFIPLEEANEDGQYRNTDNFPSLHGSIFSYNNDFKDQAFIDFALHNTTNRFYKNAINTSLLELIAYAIEHGIDVAVADNNVAAISIFYIPKISDMVTSDIDYES